MHLNRKQEPLATPEAHQPRGLTNVFSDHRLKHSKQKMFKNLIWRAGSKFHSECWDDPQHNAASEETVNLVAGSFQMNTMTSLSTGWLAAPQLPVHRYIINRLCLSSWDFQQRREISVQCGGHQISQLGLQQANWFPVEQNRCKWPAFHRLYGHVLHDSASISFITCKEWQRIRRFPCSQFKCCNASCRHDFNALKKKKCFIL